MLRENPESLFQSWLGEHGATILKIAKAYTLTPEDCQDLAQEISLQLWRSLPQFQGRSSALTWIYRVALNTALGWQRKERRRRSRQESVFDLEALSIAAATNGSPATDGELVGQLYAAIRQLPKADTALVLLYLDGLSYRQMAEVLGITESNVGVKLNRARSTLSQFMKGAAHEP